VSYSNLESVSKTFANKIWQGIKDDEQIKQIIHDPCQISLLAPKDAQSKLAQISVFLYNVAELSSMRNQPQTKKPPTLLYLNLHYLITPLTQNIETDHVVLGKIMQLFAQTPILRGSDLQGSLSESGEELKVTLDALTADDLNKLWNMLMSPYKLSIGYSVFPVTIQAAKPLETKPVPPKNLKPTNINRKA
jgi:hypothetical protein